MAFPQLGPCPPRLADLKREIANSYPHFAENITQAWNDVLTELKTVTDIIATKGSDVVPQINFSDLVNIEPQVLEDIRRKGCVVVRNVVDDNEALSWKSDLQEYVKKNPTAPGFPPEDKQFFMLYWTQSQVRARAHPNVLAASAWLNNMYHHKDGKVEENVDLSMPLSYADRFRMRTPGTQWVVHPPHVDGGSIERWEDKAYRSCFEDILSGNWRQHDPYDLGGRIKARTSMYGKENQATVFRTYQGWLAMSETAPKEGTLQVFPDVFLANAYIMLRPFFTPADKVEGDPLDPVNWKFDISSPDFPGIYSSNDGAGFTGPLLNPQTHPHLRLENTMVSVPKVLPGDMVFWHCDLIHAVEIEHNGANDSSVMYISAVPYTPQNAAYIDKQKENFLKSKAPPDYPPSEEAAFAGTGSLADILSPQGRKAMGFTVEVF
ncbi:hypothetical protein NM688_g2785 [Phlebia brevispora]|uniref:Uncharacterized protein n=1 Tax=Phlebia brevispora TaxID=194682 RepID=A0ACC1T7T7_9APHY|nr:hypothetical protein NM688_g2785 [Phlebia brevispora]